MWEHHAYLLLGERQNWLAKLKPDLPTDRVYREAENFGIGDAPELKQKQQVAVEARRFFIISFRTITLEAQNALLKTLEEPGAGNHFFLITGSQHGLLPTLLSRVQIMTVDFGSESKEKAEAGLVSDLADNFLKSDYETRLKLAGDYLAAVDEADETKTSSVKSRALALVNVLEACLHEQFEREPSNASITSALENISKCRNYLHDQAALPKMILEHLALTLPLVL